MRRFIWKISLAGSVLAACLGLSGCSTTGLFKWSQDDIVKAGPTNPVVQILGLWQPGEGTGLDHKTTRGFIGQVYFFSQNGHAPVQVDGDVRIYVFDDQGTEEQQIKPFHQFDYQAESWKAHMAKSQLGPVYSVFIPYTRKGSHEAHCSLRIRHTSPNGMTIHSEMANIVLPGRKGKSLTAGKVQGTTGKTLPGEINTENAVSAAAGDKSSPSAPSEKLTATERRLRSMSDIQEMLSKIPKQNASQRVAAVPLTLTERERILREAQAKLVPETAAKSPPALPVEDLEFVDPAPRAKAAAATGR